MGIVLRLRNDVWAVCATFLSATRFLTRIFRRSLRAAMSKIYLIKKSALSFARASSAFEMWILEWNAIGEYRGWRDMFPDT